MTKKILGLLVLLFIFSACSKPREKKVMLIIIDGVPADVVETVNTPHMDQIAKVGAYARAYQGGEINAYSQTPTISAPGYMNMITGVWANKHNVWGNAVREPNYNYWSIFRAVEELQPELETAIFSTWEDNRTKLVGESKAGSNFLKLDYSFDGFELDTVAFLHNNGRLFIHQIDEHVTNEAARYLKENGPDLSWVYLEYTDDMGHAFGDSPQMTEAVEMADDQIGRIWEAIRFRQDNFNEEWMIVVTTDHGRTAENGKGHGGQSERERTTWIVTNLNDLNSRFGKGLAVVDIMPTALRFLEINMPDPQRVELDGVPFAGGLSISAPKAEFSNGNLALSWNGSGEGYVTISYTDTNEFARGGEDTYQYLGKAKVQDQQFETEMEMIPGLYKFVLEGKHNQVNTWLKIGSETSNDE